MKKLRMIVTVLFVISIFLFIGIYVMESLKDDTVPVITIEDEIIDVSLKMEESELLAGVTAYDEKDGDITSKIIIESISNFTEDKTSVVCYAVCDEDNHVASAKRKIRFKDYTKPYFKVEKSLIFDLGEDIDIGSMISAYDCIDGDISDRVIITATDYETNTAGMFKISVRATNSMGDTIYTELPVYVEEKNHLAPEIVLKEYFVQTKVGESFNLTENIVGATDNNENKLHNAIINTNYDPNTPGVYQVHYYTTDSQNRKGHSILTIVVEG